VTGAGGAGASDTDVFDDLRHIAGLALSRAGKTGPIREGLEPRIARVDAALQALERLREICTAEEPEKPGELDRLNPYKRGWIENPTPTEQPARFLHGVRYYLGMLEDGDSWGHSLGHIEELCREFQAAADARVGKVRLPLTSEQLTADMNFLWSFVMQLPGKEYAEQVQTAADAHNRIKDALSEANRASARAEAATLSLAERTSELEEAKDLLSIIEMHSDRMREFHQSGERALDAALKVILGRWRPKLGDVMRPKPGARQLSDGATSFEIQEIGDYVSTCNYRAPDGYWYMLSEIEPAPARIANDQLAADLERAGAFISAASDGGEYVNELLRGIDRIRVALARGGK